MRSGEPSCLSLQVQPAGLTVCTNAFNTLHRYDMLQAIHDRLPDLARAVDRLATLGSQDALILLRSSFSAPKVLHLLRCLSTPSVSHPSLDRFDSLLRSAIERTTNFDLSDTQWLQASLPVRDGGLGVRRVASLALPALWRPLRIHFAKYSALEDQYIFQPIAMECLT